MIDQAMLKFRISLYVKYGRVYFQIDCTISAYENTHHVRLDLQL